MTDPSPELTKARSLREEFDRSFAAAVTVRKEETLSNFLKITSADFTLAVPVECISGLVPGRKVIPLPGAFPGLLGVAGYRTSIVPVVALRSFFGFPPGDATRWFFLVRQADPLAIAFDAFRGHLRVPVENVSPARLQPASGSSRDISNRTLRHQNELIPVLDVLALSQEISRRARSFAAPAEK